MITVAICEDNFYYIQSIETIIKDSFSHKVITYSSGNALMEAFNQDNSLADIYIMDIELQDSDGYELAAEIKKINNKAIIIFLTNYDNYVFQAYEIDAFRYISKRDMDTKLIAAVDAATKRISTLEKDDHYIIVGNPTQNSMHKIYVDDIVRFEKIQRNIEITLVNGEIVIYNDTIRTLLDDINDDRFVFAKKGVVINVGHIYGFDKETAVMVNNIEQHITRNNIKEVKLRTMKNWR